MTGNTSETHGLTTFTHEACESVDAIAHYVPSKVANEQGDLQDLKAYFQRPRSIFSSTIATANFGTVSLDVTMANIKGWFPQVAGRLGGVYAWRFKLRFRVQLVATPFHQGILCMAFQHQSNSTNFDRVAHSSMMTNVPHVKLDISELTACELEVPFVAPVEYWPIADDTTTYGELALGTILPVISVAGQAAIPYNVYLTIEDIEFFGANQWATTSITLQSGVMMDEIKNNHLVSKSLATVAKVSSFIAKGIPSLSAIAGPVSWAADTAAGVARYFGYSRPLVQDPAVRTYIAPNAHENNVDLPMVGNTLGLMATNTLAISPEFGATDLDEMALDYVCSRYSQVCVGYVSATDTEGSAVYASPVTPSAFWYRRPASAPYCQIAYPVSSSSLISQSGNCFVPSHVMWWASFFRAWRGSLKLRITFAKTKFHAGRYLLSFNPGLTEQVQQGNYGGTVQGPELSFGRVQPFGYSLLMDLKDGNVFDFEVPFLVPKPFISFDSSSGSLSIVCVDQLVAPSTCSSIVPFLVEVAGGSDFELADYAGPLFAPAMGNYTVYTQSGSLITPIQSPSHLTIGERIKSVKQIIQSPGYFNTTQLTGVVTKYTMLPWYAYVPSSAITAAASLPVNATLNFSGLGAVGSVVARAYLYARGGTDYHVYNASRDSSVFISVDQLPQTRSLASAPVATTSYATRALVSSTPKVLSFGDHAVHIRCPAYHDKVRMQPTEYDNLSLQTFGANGSVNVGSRLHGDFVTIANTSSQTARIRGSRAASDDAALSYYLGPPPCVIINSLASLPIEQDY